MAFGTRASMQNDRTPAVAQETCVRCCGTAHVRERGQRLICKVCKGTGRTDVVVDRKTA